MHCTSSFRMRVMNHNWSATKQRLHPQSVADISRHSVLSGDRIRQFGTSYLRQLRQYHHAGRQHDVAGKFGEHNVLRGV